MPSVDVSPPILQHCCIAESSFCLLMLSWIELCLCESCHHTAYKCLHQYFSTVALLRRPFVCSCGAGLNCVCASSVIIRSTSVSSFMLYFEFMGFPQACAICFYICGSQCVLTHCCNLGMSRCLSYLVKMSHSIVCLHIVDGVSIAALNHCLLARRACI
jgi:hypothetical protein